MKNHSKLENLEVDKPENNTYQGDDHHPIEGHTSKKGIQSSTKDHSKLDQSLHLSQVAEGDTISVGSDYEDNQDDDQHYPIEGHTRENSIQTSTNNHSKLARKSKTYAVPTNPQAAMKIHDLSREYVKSRKKYSNIENFLK